MIPAKRRGGLFAFSFPAHSIKKGDKSQITAHDTDKKVYKIRYKILYDRNSHAKHLCRHDIKVRKNIYIGVDRRGGFASHFPYYPNARL